MADTRDPLTPEDLLKHAGWIRNLARKLLQDEAAAEDVVQQTWTAAIERRPSARSELRGWLWVVARNFALRRRRQDRVLRRAQEAGALASTKDDPAAAVERGESARLVLDAVLTLPERSRQLLLLRYFENRPPREIARITGMSGDAVRSQQKRALAQLRKELQRSLGEQWPATCFGLMGPGGWTRRLIPLALMNAPLKLTVASLVLLLGVALVLAADRDEEEKPDPEVTAASIETASEVPAPAFSLEEEAARVLLEPSLAESPDDDAGGEGEMVDLQVVVTWKIGGAAIAGVPVRVNSMFPGGRYQETTAVSGSDGVAAFRLPRHAVLTSFGTEPNLLAPQHFVSPGRALSGSTLVVESLRVPGPCRVRGTVVDQDELPVPHAEVFASLTHPMNFVSSRAVAPRRAVFADALGRFEVEDLGGMVTLWASAEGMSAAQVSMADLREKETLVGARLQVFPSHELTGRVVDQDGAPVVGARLGVRLVWQPPKMKVGGPVLGVNGYLPLPFLDSDETGSFRLQILDGKGYSLHVQHDRHPSAGFDMPQGARDWTIRLEAGDRIRGRVVDAAGSPVVGARISYRGLTSREVASNASGAFVIEGIQRSRPELPDRVPQASLAVLAPGHALRVLELEGESAVSGEILVTLEASHALTGSVIDRAGDPLPNARIEVFGDRTVANVNSFREPRRLRPWEELAERCTTSADARGNFRIEELYAGTFRIKVYEPGSKETAAVVEGVAGGPAVAIQLGDGMADLIELRGRVVDAITGEPVPEFRILIRPLIPGIPSSIEDPSGEFLVPDLPEGEIRYSIRVLDPPMMAKGILAGLKPGPNRRVFELRPPVTASFRVVDPSGKPLSGIRVEVLDSEDLRMGPALMGGEKLIGTWGEGETNENGVITMDLFPGDAFVAVSRQNWEEVQRWPVCLGEQRVWPVELVLEE